ncbi:multidrug transporter [Cohnella faecalis]|uniref:Multidrug transporter n=2 Tax=Cohnella faecalis TaxID=2315694 RepID=A0A398CN23_9BACL|nr:multidrug transporter [Cohnella faecalis]
MTACYLGAVRKLESLAEDEEGIGTLEIVLIAAVIIAIALLFKDWILDFLESLMDKVEGKSDTFFG